MLLTSEQTSILEATGHLLVTGGPGAGKTSIAIRKAADLALRNLRDEQRVLFLSFARATVARVIEAIELEQKLPAPVRRRLTVETYHSFFWRILRAPGYLLGLPRALSIVTPSDEAVALSSIRGMYAKGKNLSTEDAALKRTAEQAERVRLAEKEGRVCFDLFASYVATLTEKSKRIRHLVATMHPVIMLDEFQDTNESQWRVVKSLGGVATLVALADPQQRIFDFVGAHPARLDHFRKAFGPTEVDLGVANHRSGGTGIRQFADDMLKGHFSQEDYTGVELETFSANKDQAMTALVTAVYRARKRLSVSGRKNWSLAVLVPTKKMTRLVSDAFRMPPAAMKEIPHVASIEIEAAILAAEVVAVLLQREAREEELILVIAVLRNYYHGRGAADLTKGSLEEAARLAKAYDERSTRLAASKEVRANSILVPLMAVLADARKIELTGNPDADWKAVRRVMEEGGCSRIKEVAADVRNLRLLERGSQLRHELSENWRENGKYSNAATIVSRAFASAYFASAAKPETGVVLMNMHKAKGKQFDEVIIFEGWPILASGKIMSNSDRIVPGNLRERCDDSTKQNFRVSLTRAKVRVSILTPEQDPCVLLFES